MYLVHPKKGSESKWEVAWIWLPHFIAADVALVKHVDAVLTEENKGKLPSQEAMHLRVLELILEKYQFTGLKEYLHAINAVVLGDQL